MNASSTYLWWHCSRDTDKPALVDSLCQRGQTLGRKVAALTAPEQLISNLSVRENIELPCAWECREKPLAPPVLECLQRGFKTTHMALEDILLQQGTRLSAGERRWLGMARALHAEADWLVVEDDEKHLHAFDDERLLAIAHYFPALTLHWVSLHKPATLPAGWIHGDPGEFA